ncbi:hypothetical protein [Janthinobacterium sp. BJB401]|uniref:hypothetical protein n=1 Tax=Janthinobacterium sp. BJB401 TaxID=2745934 RepID=UPI001594FFB0|nr:hypothetical protein [Janthinobacterium sp. BJB401]NVI82911.1 hypothetical protein [Janthinobacterium sp. BJB401]
MTSANGIALDLASDMDIEQLFQKYVVDGTSYFFRDFLKDVDQEYQLRHDLAAALKISINDVVIVGSAKLGFSIKNHNFSKFDERYQKNPVNKNKSDVDIAIVSKKIFDQQTELIFETSRHFSPEWIEEKWIDNIYYPSDRERRMKGLDPIFQNYTKYISRGWLRPDFTPNIYINQSPWKTSVDNWYGRLQRKISIGLYSEWYYLKHYQMDNLISLRIKTKQMEISHG